MTARQSAEHFCLALWRYTVIAGALVFGMRLAWWLHGGVA